MENHFMLGIYQTLVLMNFGLLNILLFIGCLLIQIGSLQNKNTVAVIASNTIMFSIALLAYLFIGQQIIYGSSASEKTLLVWLSRALKLTADPVSQTAYSPAAAAFFQLMLPAIALSIVNAATAERLKIWSFILFSAIFSIVIYPVLSACYWGHGFLYQLGFIDRAGSANVFLLGASAGLTGSILMGPRWQRFTHAQQYLSPSHCSLMALGFFFVWLGCAGFNAGVHELGERLLTLAQLQTVLTNTLCVGAAGIIAAAIVSRLIFTATDIAFMFNGLFCALAALAAYPMLPSHGVACIIGLSCGSLIIPVQLLTEKLGVDDPTGIATSAAFGSILGLLSLSFSVAATDSVGLQLLIQSCGILVTVSWGVFASILAWLLIKVIMGLRVNQQDEQRGLDIIDCAMHAYPRFEHTTKP